MKTHYPNAARPGWTICGLPIGIRLNKHGTPVRRDERLKVATRPPFKVTCRRCMRTETLGGFDE